MSQDDEEKTKGLMDAMNTLVKKEPEIKPCPSCNAKMEPTPYGPGYQCGSCKKFFSWNYHWVVPGLNSIPLTNNFCPSCNQQLRLHPTGFFICVNSACRTYTYAQLLVFDAEVHFDG